MKLQNYKELIVWQKSVDLVEKVFQVTRTFPQTEVYGIVNQMRRAAVAVPSNIAEGAGRNYTKEFIKFLSIAFGSANELETQLIIAKRLKYLSEQDYEAINGLLNEIFKMLNVLMSRLSAH